MKVTVTHLKAPWPAGTVPGHVVELAGVDAIPGWALGKCTPAPDDAEAVSVWLSPAAAAAVAELVVNPASAAPADPDAAAADAAAVADAEAQAAAERPALEAEAAKASKRGKAAG